MCHNLYVVDMCFPLPQGLKRVLKTNILSSGAVSNETCLLIYTTESLLCLFQSAETVMVVFALDSCQAASRK